MEEIKNIFNILNVSFNNINKIKFFKTRSQKIS